MKNNNYYQNSRSEILEFIPKKCTKVLEIGCGEGNFIKNLTSISEYWGVESNSHASTKAKKILTKVIEGDFLKYHHLIPDNYFDLIICNDVIEHVDDYNLFFLVLKKKMTTNGTIVGSIPNVRYVVNLYNLFFLKDWKYVNEGILDKTHLRFFTKKSLKRIFIKHNFEIIKYKGINKVSISIKSIKSIIKYLLIFIFGKDTKYLQFGFCLKKISN